MKTLFAVALASVYGLTIRLFYGFLDGFMGIMSLSFLVIVPMLVGFLTIILIPRKKVQSGSAAFFKPWLTSLVLLALTIILSIEGVICWIMIYPFFAILAGIGGTIAYNMRKPKYDDTDIENIGKVDNDTLKISFAFLTIPLVLGVLEGDRALTAKEMLITKEVLIPAKATTIWQQIIHLNKITPGEKHTSFSNALGFPQHLYTTLDTAAIGGKRTAVYQNGLTFDEVIAAYEPDHLMVLTIKNDASKIPANVLDEHIAIGGKHVDILEDVYQLDQLPNGNCRLSLSSKFMINTPFNWYAAIWAKYLMGDLLQGELNLIKQRAITATK